MKKIWFVLLTLLISSSAYAIDLKDFVVARDADVSPGSDSLVYCVDDPGGTPLGKKCTLLSMESALEGFLDLENLQGAVTDSQVPNDITVTLSGTATALAANGGNCSSGQAPLGVDASGAVESCFDVWTEAENTSAGYAPLVSPSFTTPTLGVATATSINKVAITAPATSATLTIANGKTLTATNTVNLNTMTDGKWCKYSTSGTALDCNVDPVVDTNTTYSASGTLLDLSTTTFSVKAGTLTDTKGCKFTTANGLVCDQTYLTAVASDSDWTGHNSYPAACSAGQYASAIGDTLTCGTPTDTNTNASTICAGTTTYLDGEGNCDDISGVYAPLVSPSFTTPTLGVATATSVNKVAITAPATGSTLTIADGKTLTATNTVNLNTMTDGKWCKYSTSGTALDCNVDPVTDTDDQTCAEVSGCVVGAITAVASDSTWTTHGSYPTACTAGQYVSAIGDTLTCATPTDTNTTYTAGDGLTLTATDFDFDGGDAPAGELGGTWASPTIDDSLAVSSWTLTTPTITSGLTFTDADISPDAAGELVYDNTVTGLLDGALAWYDDDAIRYLVDLATLPSNDDYVVAYDADNDGFYMKADATGAGGSGSMTTVKEADAQVGGADIVTLDFGAGFDLAESPDTEVQIGLDLSEYTFTAGVLTDNSIISDDINWLTTTDLDTAGAVKWGNIAEGELPDSSVLSSDIKNGEIVVADTAITAGRSLTWSTNDLAADAETYRYTWRYGMPAPVATDDFNSLDYFYDAVTLLEFRCYSDQTVVVNLQRDDGSAANIFTADVTCDATGGSACASGCDTTLVAAEDNAAATNKLNLVTVSVADTPTYVTMQLFGTNDD